MLVSEIHLIFNSFKIIGSHFKKKLYRVRIVRLTANFFRQIMAYSKRKNFHRK